MKWAFAEAPGGEEVVEPDVVELDVVEEEEGSAMLDEVDTILTTSNSTVAPVDLHQMILPGRHTPLLQRLHSSSSSKNHHRHKSLSHRMVIRHNRRHQSELLIDD